MAYFIQQSMYQGMQVLLPNGHRLTVDFVDEESKNGFLSTENGYIVNQIRTAITSKSGGWEEIPEADYNEALKKKANPPPFLKSRGFRKLNAGMFQPNRNGEGAAFAGAVAKPDPIAVPKPEEMKLPPRPRVGKLTT